MSDLAAPIAPAVSAPSPSPAPAPAPSPSSSQPAAPANAPAAGSTVMDSFDKQFTDLDETPTSNSQPTGETGVDHPIDPKPAAAKPAAAKPATPPPPAAKPATEPEDEFSSPQVGTLKEVRDFGKRMASMARNALTKNKELSARVQELQSRSTVPPDVEKIQKDYQRLQQEVSEHRARAERADYSQSKDYEEKYKQPYQQAYTRGRSAVQKLAVRESDEAGEIKTRPGTADDFDRLYEMSDSDADAAAEAMFGPSARRVIGLRDQAKERAEAAFNAIKENTAKFSQERQQTQAQIAQRRMALTGLWKKVNEDLHSKHAKWFAERDGDTEWNQALAKGREIAQQRFGNAYAQLSPEQRVVLDAQIFNRASAFTPMKAKMTSLETQLEEANKTIEKLRGSGPGKPSAGAAPAGEGEAKDWEEAFEKTV